MGINYQLKKTVTAGSVSDKWRRTRGHNNENVAGQIKLADFASHAKDNVIPSGIAVVFDDAAKVYKPWTAGGTLAGFLSDMTGVLVEPGVTDVIVSIAIRETIVPKYLPVKAHQSIDSTTPTTGDFVFIKE